MTPWLDDGDVRLFHGSALDVLAALPAGSVQTCVTSPPFFNLRDYGVDGQIGLEASPEEFVGKLVAVFRGVRRALRPDGTLWLEIGDSYAANRTYQVSDGKHLSHDYADSNAMRVPDGLKAKDLIGIPWRLAFALQVDGWYLRSDIIWAKPNPMPESVSDRPTKAHEYVFLLSKGPRYYFDQDAVREPHQPDGRLKTIHAHATDNSHPNYDNMGTGQERWPNGGRNIRSVWDIATQPTPEAHFATYPEELVRRCILAGSSEAGECSVCGEPWTRQVERTLNPQTGLTPKNAELVERGFHGAGARLHGPGWRKQEQASVETMGWAASCGCGVPARPQTILDPFVGSGTTALVARRHGRRAIGIDLNESYLAIAARRTAQLSLLAEGGVA